MPQSLSNILIHIIFSTKDREPWLDRHTRARAHAYIATVCRDLHCQRVHVGGVADHVHIATTLPRTLSPAKLVERVKSTSSKWIKTIDAPHRRFAWQRGYAVFSVSPSQFDPVLDYIETQEEHHRTRSFQDEYREFLHRHSIDFDENYAWD